MALAAIPDEINRHIEAVLTLSKRDVLLRILREADLCFEFEQITAAAVLAGVALEEISLTADQNVSNQKAILDVWREVRDRAAHISPGKAQIDKKTVKAMITSVRAFIEQVDRPQAESISFRLTEDALTKIRGKYAFVQTSVDAFLKRKRDDLDLEDHK